MSKAVEKANKAYPVSRGSGIDRVISMVNRKNGYIQGYIQAEKDLALTWEDLQTINDLFYQVDAENSAARDDDLIEQDLPFPYGQPFYEEVLRRFREMKHK